MTGTKQHDVVVILAGGAAAALYVLCALAAHLECHFGSSKSKWLK